MGHLTGISGRNENSPLSCRRTGGVAVAQENVI
jgi:hypothetical protein